MDIKKVVDAVDKANCALELKRKIVGVKFLFNKEEFERADAKPLRAKMPYCCMVKIAMSGYGRKANIDTFACLSAARVLGLIEANENYTSGQFYRNLGMYQDLVTAKKVCKNTTHCQHKAYGAMVKPVEEFNESPDIVIIVTNAYNVMRILQGYTYKFGTYKNFKIIGNQALCSECTAYPFESNNINISALCAGTRFMAGWDKDELGIGMPFNIFTEVVDGVYSTINIMEPNEDKKIIEEKLNKSKRRDLKIVYNKNYYTGLYNK